MTKVQVSLTPNEAKRLIARAVSQMPVVQSAFRDAKILLKGGTTVSALAEELVGTKMAISGRISPKGAKGTSSESTSSHRLLLEHGKAQPLESDSDLNEIVLQLGKGDLLITGANALDVNRKAAIMVGRGSGGSAAILPNLTARGLTTIITVGWEKLVPCSVEQAIVAAGNQTIDVAMGMTVGLIPLNGNVVTETDALEMLFGVRTTVIGAGGIMGGEGSTTLVMEGESLQIRNAWEYTHSIKGASVSGVAETLVECYPGCSICRSVGLIGDKRIPTHRGCCYFMRGLAEKVFSSAEAPSQDLGDS